MSLLSRTKKRSRSIEKGSQSNVVQSPEPLIESVEMEDQQILATNPSNPIADPIDQDAAAENSFKGFEYLSGKRVILSSEAQRKGKDLFKDVLEGEEEKDLEGPDETSSNAKPMDSIETDAGVGSSTKQPRLTSDKGQEGVPQTPSAEVDMMAEIDDCTFAFLNAEGDDDVTFF